MPGARARLPLSRISPAGECWAIPFAFCMPGIRCTLIVETEYRACSDWT